MVDYNVDSHKSVYKEMEKTYTAEEIIEYLQRRANLLGRTPKIRDINLDKDGPGKAWIEKLFVSYDLAIEAAGLEPLPRPWSQWGDDELIELIQGWKECHPDAIVTHSLLQQNPDLPSADLIRKRFGGIKQWLNAAGIEYEQAKNPWRKWRSAM